MLCLFLTFFSLLAKLSGTIQRSKQHPILLDSGHNGRTISTSTGMKKAKQQELKVHYFVLLRNN